MKKNIMIIILALIFIIGLIFILWLNHCNSFIHKSIAECNQSIFCHGQTAYGGGGLQSEIRECLPIFMGSYIK